MKAATKSRAERHQHRRQTNPAGGFDQVEQTDFRTAAGRRFGRQPARRPLDSRSEASKTRPLAMAIPTPSRGEPTRRAGRRESPIRGA